MDELESLRVMLAREPSRGVIDEGRHRLMNEMRAPTRRRTRRRTGIGLSLVAASAAGAVMVAVVVAVSGGTGTVPGITPSGTAPSGTTPPSAVETTPSARTALSGKEILLAAATTAEQAPVEVGRYWHLVYEWTTVRPRTTAPPASSRHETWGRRTDGHLWVAEDDGRVKHLPAKKGFYVLEQYFTFEELQSLPTDPDALRDLAIENRRKELSKNPDSGPAVLDEDTLTAHALIKLLYEVPVPPKVRAAAFRAIAALPNVKSAGTTEDGAAVRITASKQSSTKVVVDPQTSLLRRVDYLHKYKPDQHVKIIAAEWTDKVPSRTDRVPKPRD